MSIAPYRGKCWTCGHDHDQFLVPASAISEVERLAEQAELAKLKRKNDALLAALKQIEHATAPTHDDGAYHENAYSIAQAAIAESAA